MNLTIPIDAADDLAWPSFPYPGLRPFRIAPEADESLIFYGRNAHKDDVLERLDRSHLVSVVGPSGCGKSSLVKVGVIPALQAGLLTRAGYKWETLQMRPGHRPLRCLAAELAKLGGEYDPSYGTPEDQIHAELESKRSALWVVMDHLAPVLASDGSGKPRRVLLLVDQFEEVFSGDPENAGVDQFLALIAQFFRNPHPQLYVVLTMRTDFIGQCANFPGLAEILNQTQYITPVLRGEDLREAIARPVEAYQGAIEPDLVSEIVRDMGSGSSYDADNLPLMQHALLWMWQQSWHAAGITDPPTPAAPADGDHRVTLTLAAYRENGGLPGILRRHADTILDRVRTGGPRSAHIAEVMFRRLSERDASLRYKRAPAPASEVCRLASCTIEELDAVIDPFADIEASFVERRPRQQHPGDPMLDLSHESLIRQWNELRTWADLEAEKASTFRRIAGEAQAWEKGRRSPNFLKTGGNLAVMEEWWSEARPTPEWGRRYRLNDDAQVTLDRCFALVEAFRSECIRANDRATLWRRVRYASLPAVLMVAALLYFGFQNRLQKESLRLQEENLRAQQESLEREAVSKTRMLVAFARRVMDRRSQALAASIAAETLEEGNGFRRVPETAQLARKALQQLRETFEIQIDAQFPSSADFSADGNWLVTVNKSQLTFIDTRIGRSTTVPVEQLTSYGNFARLVRWNRSGDRLLVTTNDRAVFVLDVDPGDPTHSVRTARAIRLGDASERFTFSAFSGDGKKIATVGEGGAIRFWNAATREEAESAIEESQAMGQNGFALSFHGDRVAVPQNGRIKIFDIAAVRGATGQMALCGNQEGSDAMINAVAFDPVDANRLLAVRNGQPRICNLSDGTEVQLKEKKIDPRTRQAAFSPDGTLVATAYDDGTVRIWSNDENGVLIATLREQGELNAPLTSVRFSPDGDHLATAGMDQTIRIWNTTAVLDDDAPQLANDQLIRLVRENLPKREESVEGSDERDQQPVELTDKLRCDYGIRSAEDCNAEGKGS